MATRDRLRVALVAPNEASAEPLKGSLTGFGEGVVEIHEVTDVEVAATLAALRQCDAVVLQLSEDATLAAIASIQDAALGFPIVVHAASQDLVFAAMAIRAGAQDVVPFDECCSDSVVRRLILAIERADTARVERLARRNAENRADELHRKLQSWMSGRATLP